MKKIQWLALVILLLIAMAGCDDSSNTKAMEQGDGESKNIAVMGEDNDETVSPEFIIDSTEKGKPVQATVIGPAGEGFYKLEFSFEDKKCIGFADANGKIVYYINKDDKKIGEFTAICSTAGYIEEVVDNQKVYTLINSDGLNKTFSKDDFDEVLGGGGGYLLVYKNTGGISKEEHSYGLISSEGEWEIELTPCEKLPTGVYSRYYCVGNKVFANYDYTENSSWAIFDIENKKSMRFNQCLLLSPNITDGRCFIMATNAYGSRYYPNHATEGISLDEASYLFNMDGSYQLVQDLTDDLRAMVYESAAVYRKDGYINIWNLKSDKVIQYRDFGADVAAVGSYDGSHGTVEIRGADGKFYFTVIDENGETVLEPRLGSNAIIKGERIIYCGENRCYEMIDLKGNVIISGDQKLERLSFNGNTVYCQDNASEKRSLNTYDLDGNKIDYFLPQ